jgi:YHS domain-containing protein
MLISRRSTLVILAATATVPAIPAWASKPSIYSESDVAINGFDPVAYFNQQQPVEGSPAHSSEWNGAKWLFSNAENKAAFDANPEEFAPQYGGYCAYAVSKGYTASTDPDAWTVHDGKLYLNYSKTVRLLWSRDIPGHVASADKNWPAVLE